MGGRHQHFEDPITWTQDIRKTKFHLVSFFLTHPLLWPGTLYVSVAVSKTAEYPEYGQTQSF